MSEQSLTIVQQAIAELNETKEDDASVLSSDPSTPLLSSDSAIDSLALVRLLISVETIADDDFDKQITVVDESAFESEESPFRTVGTLIEHVGRLLDA